ncbi:MAG: hypothetical protein ACE5I1_12440 [bacterium]
MIQANLKLNESVEISIHANDTKDVLRQLAFWQSIPTACPYIEKETGEVCGKPLRFHYRVAGKDDEYEYFELLCTGDPWHKGQFHQNRPDGKTLYWKWDEPFRSYEDIKALKNGDSGKPEAQEKQNGNGSVAVDIEDARKQCIEELKRHSHDISGQMYSSWLENFESALSLEQLRTALKEFRSALRFAKQRGKQG